MNRNEMVSAGVGISAARTVEPGNLNRFELSAAEVEPWPEAVEGGVLLDELSGALTRHVVLPRWGSETLALFTLHTYAFELGEVTTYVGIESPEKRCGKTTLLGVLNKLVRRPVTAANISSSAFFRVIQELRPTLLIDEADTFLQGNEELRGILNAGCRPDTAYVVRVAHGLAVPASGLNAPQMAGGLVRFSSWCPKVLATIGRLPETLADRCIVIRMQRKTAAESCERLRNLDGERLRRQCARFVLDNREAIAKAHPEIPAELNDRAADIWEPLLALADLAGGEWPGKAREAAVKLSANMEEHTPIGALLLDLFMAFMLRGEGGDRAFSRELVGSLLSYEDRPWMEMSRGRPITEAWLAQQLRPYGIVPRTMWIAGAQAKGYSLEDFREVFQRYVPRCQLEAYRKERLERRPEEAKAAGEGQAGGPEDEQEGTE